MSRTDYRDLPSLGNNVTRIVDAKSAAHVDDGDMRRIRQIIEQCAGQQAVDAAKYEIARE
jgi:hypothetical protein